MNSVINRFEELHKYKIFLILFILSLLYACAINPHAQEAVTFAFIGYSNIGNSDFFQWQQVIATSEPTLQIIIPYFLLKLGISKDTVHLLWHVFTVNISFAAIFLLSYAIIKSKFYGLIISLILTNHNFINTNLYGIHYPSDFFYLGQLGMYFFIISVSLINLKKFNLSFYVMALNFLFHAGWGLANLGFMLTYWLFIEKFDLFNLKNFFSLILNFIFFYFCIITMNKFGFYDNLLNFNNSGVLHANSELQNQGYRESHLIDFSNYTNFKQKIFFLIKLIFFDLLILFTWLLSYFKKEKTEKFLRCFIIFTLLIYFYLFFSAEINLILSKISFFISDKLQRILVNRFLNVNNVFFIVFGLSLFFSRFSKKNSLIYTFFLLIMSFVFIVFRDQNLSFILPIYGKYINIFNLVIWTVCILSIFESILFYKKSYNWGNSSKDSNNKLLSETILLISLIIFFSWKSFENLSSNKKIFQVFVTLKDNKRPILFGGNIYGRIDPMYYSNITWVMPDPEAFYKPEKNIDIYCYSEKKLFVSSINYYDYLNKTCFQNKSRQDWINIKKFFEFEYVLVPKNIKLNIQIYAKFSDFILYRII